MSRIVQSFLLFSLLWSFQYSGFSQCITDKEKLYPDRFEEPMPFGFVVQAKGRYLVVGNTQSDSLGFRKVGLAYVYEQSAAGWNFLAILKPSNPIDYLQFGNAVSISESGETIAVAAYGYLPGPTISAVYVFQKPVTGWSSMTETERIIMPDGGNTNNTAVHFTDGDQTLVVGQRYAYDAKGNVYVLKRQSGQKFSEAQIQSLAPDVPVAEFGASLDSSDDMLAVGAPLYKQGPGGVYVFRRNTLTQQYLQEAILESSEDLGATNKLGEKVMIKGNYIGSPAIVYKNEKLTPKLFLYKKEKNSIWTNSTEFTQVKLLDDTRYYRGFMPGVELLDTLTVAVTAIYSATPDLLTNNLVGNLSIVTLNHNDWSNPMLQSIYEEPFLKNSFSGSGYGSYMTWNGKQLIFSPSRFSDQSNNFSAISSFTLSNSVWGSKIKIKLPHVNSNLAWFGYAMKRHEDILFVTSPNDSEAGNQAGAVYIHAPDSENKWREIKKVIPPWVLASDNFFGSSVSAYGDEFVAGAPYYDLSKGQLFVYQRTTSNWSSVQLKQTIKTPENHSLVEMGYRVAMSDKVLVATAFNVGVNTGTNNSIVIYKKENEQWVFKQVFNFGNSFLKNQTADVLVKGDSIMVFSGLGGYGGIGTGIYLFTPQNDEWKVTTSFVIPTDVSSLAMNLEWKENHLFVGSPATEVGGKPNVGVVIVYSKLPGTFWPVGQVYHNAIIYPPDISENKYFGYSLSNVQNTLAVGAPGAYYNSDYTIREVSGDTHIMVSKDYGWRNTYEYLRLQGDSYLSGKKDKMGFTVVADVNEFFLAAALETNERGTEAGAVYTIPTPPLVKLIPPFCNTYANQELVGYPFGGTWSGPGVIESDKFYLQPNLLSPGKYELTYKTSNCAFEGKLEVEILPGPPAEILTPPQVSICPQNPVTIKVNQLPLAQYRWYFKTLNSSTFVEIAGQQQPSLSAGLAGEYYATVSTGYCITKSAITTVTYETAAASIGPQPVICDTTKPLTLKSSPVGGRWSGAGVSDAVNGTFNPLNLNNGKYPVTYTFKSASGCTYDLRDTVQIDALPKLSINRKPQDYCLTGLATLEVTPAKSEWNYQWGFKQMDEWGIIESISLATRTVVLAGDYKVLVSNKNCSGETNSLTVGFNNDFKVNVLPDENPITICDDLELQLAVAVREGASVEWWWRNTISAEKIKLGGGITFDATLDGFYSVVAKLGFCENITEEKQLTFVGKDSLVVPNVFTPNGDGLNEFFDASENINEYSMKVFNRFGQEIFTTKNHQNPWRGEDHPTGTYFWLIQYAGCKNEERQAKGYVQLVR